MKIKHRNTTFLVSRKSLDLVAAAYRKIQFPKTYGLKADRVSLNKRFFTRINRRCILGCLIAPAYLTSCSAPSQFMGVSLRKGGAEVALQALARRARDGDKDAQLQLGILFEEGRGINRDMNAARELYRRAAADDTVIAYSPPSGNASYGSVDRLVQNNTGLDEAKRRLHNLDELANSTPLTGKNPR